MKNQNTILVVGATGRQGGAVSHHLLNKGWKVKALTRNANGEKAKNLVKAGADVVQGDLDEPGQIRHFFDGVYGVFSVQNPWITGLEKEVEHGIRVADLAKEARVKHFVYSSAGTGEAGTGVPHFESKVKIERHIKNLSIPYTILRPAGFMELMSDKDFVPPLVAWNVIGKMLGNNFPLSWISIDDVGAVTAAVFSNPQQYIGKELMLAGDIKSMQECRNLYREIFDKNLLGIPAPVWLFKLMQNDLYQMFTWMKSEQVSEKVVELTRQIIGETTSVRQWMTMRKSAM